MSETRAKIDTTPFTLDLTGLANPLDWSVVFGNSHPVELEVGSGKGLFLHNAALANPGRNFVGIELAKKYATKATGGIRRLPYPSGGTMHGSTAESGVRGTSRRKRRLGAAMTIVGSINGIS